MNCKYCKADCCSRGKNRDAAFCAGWEKMTNADYIRAMTDEELANVLTTINHSVKYMSQIWLYWLKQDADEETQT